jgi:uncharacterized membrane protein
MKPPDRTRAGGVGKGVGEVRGVRVRSAGAHRAAQAEAPRFSRDPRVPARRSDRASAGALAVLWAMVAAYAAVLTALCVGKYRNFLYDDIDLAIFAQATGGILNGSLASTIRGVSWLGDHSSLNLFLIAPVYALFGHPVTLLVIQSVALALGAVAVFRIARREIGSESASLALAAAYLAHPALAYLGLFEFHPEALSTPALLFTFDALRAGRLGRTIAFAALALLGKEDVAPVVGMMGLYAMTQRSAGPRFGVSLLVLAAASLGLTFMVLKPALGGEAASYGRMYAQWGGTPAEIARNLATHPLSVLEALHSTPGNALDTGIKRLYYLHMLLPLGFLPLLGPGALLIALPAWLAHFLSWRVEQHSIVFQYTALVIPFVAAAGVTGVRNLLAWLPRARSVARAALWLLPLAGIVCHAWYGPLVGPPWDAQRTWGQRVLPARDDLAMKPFRERMVSAVPAGGGVVAGFEFLARFAAREHLEPAHHVLSGRYTFSDAAYPTPSGITAMIVDVEREQLLQYVDAGTPGRVSELLQLNGLVLGDAAGGLLLFTRSPAETLDLVRAVEPPPASAEPVVFDDRLAWLGAEIEPGPWHAGDAVPVRNLWIRTGPIESLYLARLVLLDPSRTPVIDHWRLLGYGLAPPSSWDAGVAHREEHRLVLSPGLSPGRHSLGMQVYVRSGLTPQPAQSSDPRLRETSMFLPLGEIVIVP